MCDRIDRHNISMEEQDVVVVCTLTFELEFTDDSLDAIFVSVHVLIARPTHHLALLPIHTIPPLLFVVELFEDKQ